VKLIVPPLVIEDNEGFSFEKDIFHRKAYGEQLQYLIVNTSDEMVIALDAPWGEGKSTFIRMWQGHLRESDIQSIYFDSFENDYQESPFLALAGEIFELIEDDDIEEKSQFKEKTVSALKTFGRVSLRVGMKTVTAGLLDETIFDDTGTDKDAAKEVSDIVDKYVATQLESVTKNKQSLIDFREYLAELPNKLGVNGKPIIFIIDELDRCKPTFALAVIEIVKHLFSVPNITFVLVMNRDQLEESVRCEYGIGVEAEKYLQKFVTLWASLPKNTENRNCDAKVYLSDCLSRMEMEITSQSQSSGVEIYEELVVFYNMSLREIERTLTNYAIIHNMTDGNLVSDYQWMSVYLSIIKVLFPSTYRKLSNESISYGELVIETKLENLVASWWGDEKPESHALKWFLRYFLASEEELKILLEAGNFSTDRFGERSAINTVCKWLDSFQRN